MHRAFSEWRRPGSTCHGALVWLLRDLWPGAGWGVIDAGGTPKAAYFHLKRTLRPFCVLVSDEGLDGLSIHALNEGPSDVDVEVVLTLFRSGDVLVARNALSSRLPARSAITIPARQLLDTFIDVTFAYRFGPPSHDLVVVTLRDRAGVRAPSSAFYFPLGLSEAREPDVGLDATATPAAGGAFDVVVSARRFAQSVALDVEDAAIDDNYFHLEPGGQKTLRVEPKTPRSKLTGTVRALNAHAGTRIKSTE